MIADHYLLVQRWRPNFDPWALDHHRRIAAWIRIPVLPLEFFNAESLHMLGNLIGRTLKVDSITYTTERGRFARICVELDLLFLVRIGQWNMRGFILFVLVAANMDTIRMFVLTLLKLKFL